MRHAALTTCSQAQIEISWNMSRQIIDFARRSRRLILMAVDETIVDSFMVPLERYAPRSARLFSLHEKGPLTRSPVLAAKASNVPYVTCLRKGSVNGSKYLTLGTSLGVRIRCLCHRGQHRVPQILSQRKQRLLARVADSVLADRIAQKWPAMVVS